MVLRAWSIWILLLMAPLAAYSSAQSCSKALSPFAPEFTWAPYSLNEFTRTHVYSVLTQNADPSEVAKLVRKGRSAQFRHLVLDGRGAIETALDRWSGLLSERYSRAERTREALNRLYAEYLESVMRGDHRALWRRQPALASLCAVSVVGCAASAAMTFLGYLPVLPGATVSAALGAVYGGSFYLFFQRDLARVSASLPAPASGGALPDPFSDLLFSLRGVEETPRSDLGVVIELPRENVVVLLTSSPRPQLELVSVRY